MAHTPAVRDVCRKMLRTFSISKPRNPFGIEFASSALPNRAVVERAVVERPGDAEHLQVEDTSEHVEQERFPERKPPFRVSLDASVAAVDGPGPHEKS